jgi:hypothetical protein
MKQPERLPSALVDRHGSDNLVSRHSGKLDPDGVSHSNAELFGDFRHSRAWLIGGHPRIR